MNIFDQYNKKFLSSKQFSKCIITAVSIIYKVKSDQLLKY